MQISRPFQILLAAVVVLGAAWFVVLKPKGASTSSSAPPAATTPAKPTYGTQLPGSLGRAVAAAQGASAKSNAANARNAAGQTAASNGTAPATSTPASTPTTSTPTATAATNPAASTSGSASSRTVHVAVPQSTPAPGVVTVMLFINPHAADDQAVAAELASIGTQGGRVVKQVVPIDQLSHYGSITSKVPITTSPTLLVIPPSGAVQEMTGLVDTANIQQAVTDALAS